MPENQRVCLLHLLQFVDVVGKPPFRAVQIGVISIDSLVQLGTPGIEADKSASLEPEGTDCVALRWNHTLAQLTQWWEFPETFYDACLQVHQLFGLCFLYGMGYFALFHGFSHFGAQGVVHLWVRCYA